MTSEYPDFVFVVYDGDTSDQTYDITVSCEAGTLVGIPVKYIRHDLNTRAVPDVPELERYDRSPNGMVHDCDGYHTPYKKAAAMLAAKDVEIAGIKDCVKGLFDDRAYNRERAEAAEAKNIELEAAWLNAEGKISGLEVKLAQYEAQEPVARLCEKLDGGHCFMSLHQAAPYINPVYASPAPTADLREENVRLREALEAEARLSDRLAAALEYVDDYSLSYPDLGTISAVAQPALEAHETARAALNPSEPKP